MSSISKKAHQETKKSFSNRIDYDKSNSQNIFFEFLLYLLQFLLSVIHLILLIIDSIFSKIKNIFQGILSKKKVRVSEMQNDEIDSKILTKDNKSINKLTINPMQKQIDDISNVPRDQNISDLYESDIQSYANKKPIHQEPVVLIEDNKSINKLTIDPMQKQIDDISNVPRDQNISDLYESDIQSYANKKPIHQEPVVLIEDNKSINKLTINPMQKQIDNISNVPRNQNISNRCESDIQSYANKNPIHKEPVVLIEDNKSLDKLTINSIPKQIDNISNVPPDQNTSNRCESDIQSYASKNSINKEPVVLIEDNKSLDKLTINSIPKQIDNISNVPPDQNTSNRCESDIQSYASKNSINQENLYSVSSSYTLLSNSESEDQGSNEKVEDNCDLFGESENQDFNEKVEDWFKKCHFDSKPNKIKLVNTNSYASLSFHNLSTHNTKQKDLSQFECLNSESKTPTYCYTAGQDSGIETQENSSNSRTNCLGSNFIESTEINSEKVSFLSSDENHKSHDEFSNKEGKLPSTVIHSLSFDNKPLHIQEDFSLEMV